MGVLRRLTALDGNRPGHTSTQRTVQVDAGQATGLLSADLGLLKDVWVGRLAQLCLLTPCTIRRSGQKLSVCDPGGRFIFRISSVPPASIASYSPTSCPRLNYARRTERWQHAAVRSSPWGTQVADLCLIVQKLWREEKKGAGCERIACRQCAALPFLLILPVPLFASLQRRGVLCLRDTDFCSVCFNVTHHQYSFLVIEVTCSKPVLPPAFSKLDHGFTAHNASALWR